MSVNLIHGDCSEVLTTISSSIVDLVVTSPPYDSLRNYNNSNDFTFDKFKTIAEELKRVLKNGSVIVWIVNDQTINGSESGSSFRQVLHFKEIGFNLHDTMIWHKIPKPLTHNRYEQHFEYMFVLSKGKPKTFNPIFDKPNKRAGETVHGTIRNTDGSTTPMSGNKKKIIKENGMRGNIWTIFNPGKKGTLHPATFPLELARDHVISWSNKDDLVLDPFMGSGTTGVACLDLQRKFLGIEKDEEYFEIAKQRINENKQNLFFLTP